MTATETHVNVPNMPIELNYNIELKGENEVVKFATGSSICTTVTQEYISCHWEV